MEAAFFQQLEADLYQQIEADIYQVDIQHFEAVFSAFEAGGWGLLFVIAILGRLTLKLLLPLRLPFQHWRLSFHARI